LFKLIAIGGNQMLIPIVNENDEIIDHIERNELDYSIHRSRSSSCWVLDGKSNVLIAQRSFDKRFNPGKWSESVGGTVDKDCSYRDTIIKEIGEELGVDLANFDLIEGIKQYIDADERYFVQWYTVIIDRPAEYFKIQNEELEQVAWISIEQLKREVKEMPGKYVSGMDKIIQTLDFSK